MAGIRVKHPTLRNGLYLVRHYRRYKVPLACPTCKVIHTHKTYHINLDDAGCAIVSLVVLERLKEVGMADLEIINEVKKPPPITLQIPGSITNKFKVFELGAKNAKR